jgi:hypothetical protein
LPLQFRVFDAKTQNYQPISGSLFVQLIGRWHFLPAWTAPGRPDVEENPLASVVGRAVGFTVKIHRGHCRCGNTGQGKIRNPSAVILSDDKNKKTTLESRFDLISLRFVKNLANCYVQPSNSEGKGSRCYYGNAYNNAQGTHLTVCLAHIPVIIYKGVH